MNKLITFLFLFLFGISFAMAQEEDIVKREKMMRDVKEYKMKYLAQEMELSEVQKKKFFELYDEMQESRKECFHDAVAMDRKLKGEKEADEEDYLQVRNAFSQAQANWTPIEAEYDDKFAEFLTQKQIYKMKEAENNFRSKMEELKHNRKRDHHKR